MLGIFGHSFAVTLWFSSPHVDQLQTDVRCIAHVSRSSLRTSHALRRLSFHMTEHAGSRPSHSLHPSEIYYFLCCLLLCMCCWDELKQFISVREWVAVQDLWICPFWHRKAIAELTFKSVRLCVCGTMAEILIIYLKLVQLAGESCDIVFCRRKFIFIDSIEQ